MADTFVGHSEQQQPSEIADDSWGAALRRCADVLKAKDLVPGEPFDLEEFIKALERREGRRIHLTPIRATEGEGATLCGCTILMPGKCAVYYVDSHSPLHRTHNKVHELAHLILGHRRGGEWAGDNREERDADAMAAVLLSQWHSAPAERWAALSSMQQGAVRLTEVFRGRQAVVALIVLLLTSAAALTCGTMATAERQASVAGLLAAVSSGAAATVLFALARRAAPWSPLVAIPPVAAGLLVVLTQAVLFAAARNRPTLGPELVALRSFTTGWWIMASGALLLAGTPYLPHLRDRALARSLRLGTAALAVGAAGELTAVFGALAVATARNAEPLERVGLLLRGCAIGLIVAGLLLVWAARPVGAVNLRLTCWRAYHQLRPLAELLARARPEWAQGLELSRRGELLLAPRRAQALLYQRVIMIRDASWALLASLDADIVDRAVDYACLVRGAARGRDVEALAEACWLAYAARAPGATIVGDPEIVLVDSAPDPAIGSLADEVEFLRNVADQIRRPELIAGFHEQLRRNGCPT